MSGMCSCSASANTSSLVSPHRAIQSSNEIMVVLPGTNTLPPVARQNEPSPLCRICLLNSFAVAQRDWSDSTKTQWVPRVSRKRSPQAPERVSRTDRSARDNPQKGYARGRLQPPRAAGLTAGIRSASLRGALRGAKRRGGNVSRLAAQQFRRSAKAVGLPLLGVLRAFNPEFPPRCDKEVEPFLFLQ